MAREGRVALKAAKQMVDVVHAMFRRPGHAFFH
jgi:hypothetical protein